MAGLVLKTAGWPWGLVAFSPALSLLEMSVTPLLRLAGVYRYYSPLLKVSLRTSRVHELHTGAALDYLLNLRLRDRGRRARRKVLRLVLEGLLQVAREVEEGRLSRDVEIQATSYFFDERNARRLGFSISPPSWRHRLNILVHGMDILFLYSFTRGRLAFPPLSRLRTATLRGGELVWRAPQIRRLAESLSPGSRLEGTRRTSAPSSPRG